MRIFQVGTGAVKIPPQKYGGVELHIYLTSKHMVETGHDVAILDIRDSETDPQTETIDNTKFLRLHTKRNIDTSSRWWAFILSKANLLAFALKVNDFIRKTDVDIIHLHATLIGLVLVLLNRNLRPKMVFTVESPIWDMGRLSWWDRLSIVADYYLIRRVGQVVVFTEALKKRLEGSNKVDPQKVAVIHLGVDVGKFRPGVEHSDIIKEYGLHGRVAVLFVGRIVPYKGVEYLVKAADIIINHLGERKVVFLLVGPLAEHDIDRTQYASYVRKILEFLQERNLEANVRLTGAVPFDDLPRFFSACDVFVLPSLGETFGLVVSQAMAAAKPIVGTRLAGIQIQVRDGWNGYLVEPANEKQLAEKIKFLIDNPEERKRMGENSRRLAEREFGWSQVSAKLVQTYEAMLRNM